ncbi:hypothetical protein ABPG72_003029 [Tetrahymena utriculariae]
MGNKLPENIQQQCLKYGQDQKEILNLMDYLKNKGYQCQDIIGKGANGVVLRAFSQKLNRGVAIKCIKVEDKSFEKLKSEYDVIQKFKQASYLLQAFDSFQVIQQAFNLFFIVTELCEGDLSDLISSKKQLNRSQILKIFTQLLLGIIEMEQNQILHLDIKPKNILFREFQGSYQVKFADFGLSKNISSKGYTSNMSGRLGTYNYVSYEVLNEIKPYSHKTDLYSLGIVFIELLLGRLIKEDKGEPALLRNDKIYDVIQNNIQDQFLVDKVIKKMVTRHDQRESAQELLFKVANLLLQEDLISTPDKKIYFLDQDQLLLDKMKNSIGYAGATNLGTGISQCKNLTFLSLHLKQTYLFSWFME